MEKETGRLTFKFLWWRNRETLTKEPTRYQNWYQDILRKRRKLVQSLFPKGQSCIPLDSTLSACTWVLKYGMGFTAPPTLKGSTAALGHLPWNFFLQTQLHTTSLEVLFVQYYPAGPLRIKLTLVHRPGNCHLPLPVQLLWGQSSTLTIYKQHLENCPFISSDCPQESSTCIFLSDR